MEWLDAVVIGDQVRIGHLLIVALIAVVGVLVAARAKGRKVVPAATSLVGKVCRCGERGSIGRPGLVTGQDDLPWGRVWVGIGLDDGSPWSSRSPVLVPWPEVVALAKAKAIPYQDVSDDPGNVP